MNKRHTFTEVMLELDDLLKGSGYEYTEQPVIKVASKFNPGYGAYDIDVSLKLRKTVTPTTKESSQDL